MEGSYEILMGGKRIGTAKITRQGLYYGFDCRCRLSGDIMCRITVTCGGKTCSLGIPVPEGDVFALRTKLPVKQLGEGVPQFQLQPKHRPVGGEFVPISPEEPFAYLSRLTEAFLEIRDGKVGLVIGRSRESGQKV